MSGVDNLHAFVGRAHHCSSVSDVLTLGEHFELWFDQEDFLVFTATDGQLSEQEVVDTGFCSAISSSFARNCSRAFYHVKRVDYKARNMVSR